MLKLATPRDEDRVLEMLSRFFETTRYSSENIDKNKARNLIRYCSNQLQPESCLILWEVDSRAEGLIAGQITEVIFNTQKVATELAWWVEPKFRKTEAAHQLLGAFEYWASLRGCSRVQMLSLENEYSAALNRLYKKQGYAPAETSYVKEL